MKRNLLLIFLIILCTVNFLFNWFDGEIFDKVFIISFIYTPIIMILEFFLLLHILNILIRVPKEFFIKIVICLLYVFNVYVLFFDFDIFKAKLKLYKNRENYIMEIDNIKKQEILEHNIKQLEKNFFNLSNGGEIYVYTKSPLMIEFWIYRGLSIGKSSGLIYIENNSIEYIKEVIKNLKYIEKIEDNWYFIIQN